MLPREDWLSIEAEVLVPAATADAINEANLHKIKARLIVEGANIPTTPGAYTALHERGVIMVPDFIANAGAAGLATSVLVGRVEPELDAAFDFISSLRARVRRVLELSRSEGISPREAAIRVVTNQDGH